MSKLTNFLKLFEWDTSNNEDLNSNFNIDKALNENFDKIDNFAANCKNDVANAIKEEITKVKEAQINSTGANLQNVQLFGESVQEAEPSIDYPSPISSITNIDYKIIGKNAIYDTFLKTKGFITYKVAKENVTKNMTFSGIINENLKANIYFSVDSKILSSGEINIIKNIKFSKVINLTDEILGLVKNSQNIFLQIYNNQVDFSNFNDKEIMLEHGTVLTDYEPYKEVKTTIALPENVELCSLPNGVVDCVDSTGVIHKKIGKMILDGTGNYGSYRGYTGEGYCYWYEDARFKIKNVTSINYKHSLCTHFKNVYANYLNNTGIGTYSDHPTLPRKYFVSDKSTLEEFKMQLAELQPTLIFELAEEETTQNLAETEKEKLQNIETFEGINNITSNAPISAVYNTDTKSYIDSKFNTLAQQILNIAGGN